MGQIDLLGIVILMISGAVFLGFPVGMYVGHREARKRIAFPPPERTGNHPAKKSILDAEFLEISSGSNHRN